MSRIINTSALLIMILIGLSAAAKPGDKPLDLIHADKFISSGKDENNIINLVGNVHLKHGNTDLKSGRAVWYKNSDLVVFIDSVHLVDSLRTLDCQNLTYYRKSGSATAVGNVVLIDKTEAVRLNASKVDYRKEDEKFIATGGPIFTLYPESDSTRTMIVADSIIYNTELKTGEALHDVEIKRQDIVATSEKAEFLDAGETIMMTGDPQVVQADNVLVGDEIELHVPARKLTEMVVTGHAKATYRSQPDTTVQEFTEAILEGKELDVFFTNGKLDMAVMSNNAVSYYTPAANDTTSDGKNIASGDSITLFFDQKDIARVLVRGGARGQYMDLKKSSENTFKPETTFYEADEIDYRVADKTISLNNNGKLSYQNMALTAGQIRYGVDDEILIAEGLKVDTDSGEVVEQRPVLSQDEDEMYGRRMTYNIGTKRGKVELGETEYDKAFFYGNELRQVDKDVVFVRSGKYIPCEDKEGGVYFYSQEMKLINKDKVIAKPVVLFIGPLPVFAIPYYIFPIRKGRHSGILTFELGDFRRGSRYIRNVGYYWAPSDYWDLTGSMDYYENDKTIFHGLYNYNIGNNLRGNLSGSFTNSSSWQNYQKSHRTDWQFGFSHNQRLSETMNLTGSGSFYSSKNYLQDNTYTVQERLNQSVTSNLSLTKRWQFRGVNQTITAAVSQNWDLQTDVKRRQLPTISFSSGTIQLIPSRKKDTSKRVLPWLEPDEIYQDKWYNRINFRVSSAFVNTQNYTEEDSVFGWTKFKTLKNDMSLQTSQKLFGILNINPSVNMQQTFYKIDEIHPADTSSNFLRTNDYFRRDVWSASVGLNTTMYGTVSPNIFGLTGLRHVFTPSISYSYAPEINRNQEYYDFTRVGSSPNRRRFVTLSMTNLFQMKLGSGDDVRKYNLFTVTTATNYDFEKEEKRWGDIGTRIQMGDLKIVDFSMTMVHSFYDDNTGELQYLSPNLKSFEATTSFNHKFSLGGTGGPDLQSSDLPDKPLPQGYENPAGLANAAGGQEPSLAVELSHRYKQNRVAGEITSKVSLLSTSFELIPTRGWKIGLDFNYDLYEKRTEFPIFRLARDLNCWGAEFNWQPASGDLSGYYFRIYLKKIPAIKIENTNGRSTGVPLR